MPQSDWFDAAKFAKATFEATGFTAKGGDAYETKGKLSLRGVTKDVTLPFTLTIEGDQAHAVGKAKLVRTDFGVGQGAWSTGDMVGARRHGRRRSRGDQDSSDGEPSASGQPFAPKGRLLLLHASCLISPGSWATFRLRACSFRHTGVEVLRRQLFRARLRTMAHPPGQAGRHAAQPKTKTGSFDHFC